VPSVAYGTQTITYDIVRKPTLKNTYINVDRDGVLVKTNTATSDEEIEAFIVKKSGWILKHLQSYKQKAIETEIRTGSRLYYLGKSYYVELLTDERRTIEVRFNHSRFIITAPKKVSQGALYQAVDNFYKEKATAKIIPLVKKWSDAMNVIPEHISFRKANKRWGSCSPTNRISFNYHLMKLPTSLIEYVVVHELTHICCKNHSPEFWSLVGNFMPDYREKEERIKGFEKLF
jgi:predicted metal-dependent hydrolase